MAKRPQVMLTRPHNGWRGWEAAVITETVSEVTDGEWDIAITYRQMPFDVVLIDLPEDFSE